MLPEVAPSMSLTRNATIMLILRMMQPWRFLRKCYRLELMRNLKFPIFDSSRLQSMGMLVMMQQYLLHIRILWNLILNQMCKTKAVKSWRASRLLCQVLKMIQSLCQQHRLLKNALQHGLCRLKPTQLL